MTQHPCGALPVAGLSLSVWYCQHHQAWWASAMTYDQQTDGEPVVRHAHSYSWGPFDTAEDVQRWLAKRVEEVPTLPV